MKTVLIIGVTGFTGQHFLKFVENSKLTESYKFVGCSRSVYKGDLSGIFEHKICDLLDHNSIKELLRRTSPSLILNFAGSYTEPGLNAMIRQNVEATRNLLEASLSINSVDKILLIGSAAEYGIPIENPVSETHPKKPVNVYGLTKLYQSELASFYYRTKHVKVLTARTFNLVGDGISKRLSVGNFIHQIKNAKDGVTLEVGNLQTYRDFLPVEEAIRHYWTLLKKGDPGEAYNVCSGKATKIEALLKDLIKKSGKNLDYKTHSSFLKKNDVQVITGSRLKLNSLYS